MEFKASPNFSARASNTINMIVIHATASESFDGTLAWLTNPESKVSAHYLVGKNGKVVQLVKDEKKAWHAGVSEWNGVKNCNDYSIGIELVNKNNGIDPYPPEQIQALAILIHGLQFNHPSISPERIVGHYQIAPGRKTDPGILFPWVKLGMLLREEIG